METRCLGLHEIYIKRLGFIVWKSSWLGGNLFDCCRHVVLWKVVKQIFLAEEGDKSHVDTIKTTANEGFMSRDLGDTRRPYSWFSTSHRLDYVGNNLNYNSKQAIRQTACRFNAQR